VVQLAGGLRLTGTLAWLAWFALHLVYLLGGRNRVTALINLTYRYVSWGHGGAVIVGDEPDDEPGEEPGDGNGPDLASHASTTIPAKQTSPG
jgi:NADH dehydrogenase